MPTGTITTKLEEFAAHSTALGETAIQLARIKAIRKTTDISANISLNILLSVAGVTGIIFCSVAGAWWLGDLVQSRAMGFLVVGFFYFATLLLLFLFKNKLLLPFLKNRIVRKIYE